MLSYSGVSNEVSQEMRFVSKLGIVQQDSAISSNSPRIVHHEVEVAILIYAGTDTSIVIYPFLLGYLKSISNTKYLKL